jgi:hypothetical protein
MKTHRQTELPRFIVGALATAGASTASAAIVQITFTGNVLSTSTGLAAFVPDLTGNGTADVSGFMLTTYAPRVQLSNLDSAGAIAWAGPLVSSTDGPLVGLAIKFGLNPVSSVEGGDFLTGRKVVPMRFTDARINNGAPTDAWVDVEAWAQTAGELGRLEIHRLIFDDASVTGPTGVSSASSAFPEWQAIPEPSSLALLALGAGGLLARRRRQAA